MATTRYVALLRAINLGRTRRVPMPRLRELLTARGYGAVRTHLSSGNVLLDSDLAEEQVAAELAELVEEEFGFAVPVVVRTGEQLAEVVAADPFGAAATDPARYSVTFFPTAPDPERASRKSARASPMWCMRSRVFFSRQRSITRRTIGGVPGGSRSKSGALLIIDAMVSAAVSRPNTRVPVSISKSTHPKAQMSACGPTSCPFACSGAI